MFLRIKPQVDTLEKIQAILSTTGFPYPSSIKQDRWSDKLIALDKCVVVKKSSLVGAKITFEGDHLIHILAVIPSPFVTGSGLIPYLLYLFAQRSQEQLVMEVYESLTVVKEND